MIRGRRQFHEKKMEPENEMAPEREERPESDPSTRPVFAVLTISATAGNSLDASFPDDVEEDD